MSDKKSPEISTIDVNELSRSLCGQLKHAVEANNPDAVEAAFISFDRALVSDSVPSGSFDGGHGSTELKRMIKEFMKNRAHEQHYAEVVAYLSDGGRNRLHLRSYSGRLELYCRSDALMGVKERWEALTGQQSSTISL